MVDRETYKLENVKIASPCTALPKDISSRNKTQYCNECHKNVFNLSLMSKREAEKLLQDEQGKLCVRLYVRDDGTIITENCPKLLRPIRNVLYKFAAAFLTIFTMAPSSLWALAQQPNREPSSEKLADKPTKFSQPRQIQIIDGGINTLPKSIQLTELDNGKAIRVGVGQQFSVSLSVLNDLLSDPNCRWSKINISDPTLVEHVSSGILSLKQGTTATCLRAKKPGNLKLSSNRPASKSTPAINWQVTILIY